MKTELKKWLAENLDTTPKNIENIINEEKATTYLWIWSIFEKRIFDGYMTTSKILNSSEILSKYYNEFNLDCIAKKIYKRYQDNKRLKNLLHKDKNIRFESFLNKTFEDLSESEKIYLLLYTAYRYRNNIFHGNKGVLSWVNYSEEINDCLSIMMSIIDVNKKQKSLIM